MTEIEETLTRALAVEADRHEAPMFDAYRIAENGGRRRKLRRGPLFGVVAGALGVAVLGGGVVVMSAGGGSSGGRVTVTFQSSTFTTPPVPLVDGDVRAWVRRTVAAEGLKDVDVSVRSNPFRLSVTGRSADLTRLTGLLGTPVVLQFRQTAGLPAGPAGPAHKSGCEVSTSTGPGAGDGPGIGAGVSAGAAWAACDRHHAETWIRSAVAPDYHVVEASAKPSATGWLVALRLDPPGAAALARLARGGGSIAVMVDGTVHAQWDATKLTPDGVLVVDGSYTEQEARELAAKLSDQGPAGLGAVTVTVSTR